MGNEGKSVRMTDEELEQFNQFKAAKAKQEEIERVKVERDQYRLMVDSEIDKSIPILIELSKKIGTTKKSVQDSFRTVLKMKAEVMKLTSEAQKSHTFTNSQADKRIKLGFNEKDDYRDTCESGIQIVEEYLESLVKDKDSALIVNGILRLLSRDQKGTLKAQKILQLKKMAVESGNDRFMEGVQIIEDSYIPSKSKEYVRAEYKGEDGEWINIPLGMTES